MSLGGGGKSRFEQNTFAALYANGILSVAAAGNGGNTRKSYPASYDSVISVAAIDSNKNIAAFSQQNSQVEIAAPGVSVRSTVPMGTGLEGSLSVDGAPYMGIPMDGSSQTSATGTLVDCGLGDSACPGASGNICLIQRGGDITFADKVLFC
jgi:serine protease